MNAPAEFPERLRCLFVPPLGQMRYRVLYGGRGGAKSWGIARALLILGSQRKLRILCARQTMKSIADSVHHLLASQIKELGLDGVWTVEQARIYNQLGSEFIFDGLQHNVANIKSKEAVDITWVEEAQNVTKASWETLIPTIRKEGSEIWASFNPELDTDDTYVRFCLTPPPKSIVQKIGWEDNPYFPQVLREEMEHLRSTDERAYDHVWGGACRSAVEGAIYEAELAKAEAEGRLARLIADPSKPVNTAWDLGFGDGVAIWVWQQVGLEVRLLDYIENERKAVDWYIKELQRLDYVWGTDYMPWDANGGQANLTGKSIADFARSLGRKVQVLPQGKVHNRINELRMKFPQLLIDSQKCADGLQALRHYEWGKTAAGESRREPLHNWASHAADAAGYLAMALKAPKAPYVVQKSKPIVGSVWA
jgi:phage terminase large subunit